MRGVVATVLVVGLLVGSAVAFGVTERLKLERSPITGTLVDKQFSPVCDCATSRAAISFRLRKRGTISVDILDSDNRTVKTLVEGERASSGRLTLRWDGRDESGGVVPDGVYRPRVRLRAKGRTIVLPNEIHVDTTRPVITIGAVAPRMFSPDGDGRRDGIHAAYTVSEHARAELLVNGRRRVLSRRQPLQGVLDWYGRVDGKSLRPGTYVLRVKAADRAGNVSRASRPAPVTIRYVELARRAMRVHARTRFGIRVFTDARSYAWRFDGRVGTGRRELLVLRAPRRPGKYGLAVRANGWKDRAVVLVEPRPRRPRRG